MPRTMLIISMTIPMGPVSVPFVSVVIIPKAVMSMVASGVMGSEVVASKVLKPVMVRVVIGKFSAVVPISPAVSKAHRRKHE